MKLDLFTCLEVIYAYTNISFTEKQKEDAPKLYDLMDSNDIFNIVISKIPQSEYKFIVNGVNETAKAIYAYNNSLAGMLENISKDYSNLDLDASSIQ
jgi:predicted nucleic acid-binding protein